MDMHNSSAVLGAHKGLELLQLAVIKEAEFERKGRKVYHEKCLDRFLG